MLWVVSTRLPRPTGHTTLGGWRAAVALLGYALPFSFAYLALDTGTGALILFAAVQLTMVLGGLLAGERPSARRWLGMVVAAGGLLYLLSPGVSAPDLGGAVLMALAGISWGLYSLLGRGQDHPTLATARNFLRATPLAVAAMALAAFTTQLPTMAPQGLVLAAVSGAVTSGLGYALWYRVLRDLRATTAAVVQLSVPAIAAGMGVLVLGESLTARLVMSSVVILGGIAVSATARD